LEVLIFQEVWETIISVLLDILIGASYTVNTDTTLNLTNNCPAIPWKYNEEKVVKELLEYIRGTYNQHYSAGDDKIQTLDLIRSLR
jgi:hypothetical protein